MPRTRAQGIFSAGEIGQARSVPRHWFHCVGVSMLAPMTFIVTLVLIGTVVFGLILLIRAFGTPGADQADLDLGTQTACPGCRRLNPTHAKYCAHCGQTLP